MSKRSYHYHKLKEVLNITQLILEDSVTGSGIEVQKRPPKSKMVGGEADYEEKRSAIMNFAKSSQNADESNDMFIQTGYKLLDKAKKAGEDAQFKVKGIVVDLTKLSNELKELKAMDEEKVTVDRIRKVLRYVNTAMNNANKTIKELNEKRIKMESDINWDQYQQELDDLNSKYGLDQIDVVDEEIAEKQAEASNSAKEIEKENKEVIRAFRALLGQLYAIPKEIAEISQVHMKAYGAVASISNKGKQYNMKKEGILKILGDEKLRKELEEFIEINDDVADRVQMVNSKIPDIGTYFAELNLKVDEELSEINLMEDEVEKAEKVKNEAFMPKIFEKTKKVFLRAVSKFFNVLQKETHDLYIKVKDTIKPVVESLGVLDGKLDGFKTRADQNYLQVQRMLREIDIEVISKAEKSLK